MRLRAKYVVGILVAAMIAVAAAVAPGAMTRLRKKPVQVPTTQVLRSLLDLEVYTTGELRAAKTAALAAPPVGGFLQIIHLAKPGIRVDPGDVVVEFDTSEQEYNLEQARSQLEEAEQEIRKMNADVAVRVAQDKVALLRAQFDVTRAELTVKGNDLLSGIEAKKNILNLDEAKRRFAQMQEDLKSRNSSDAADMAVQVQKRARAAIGIKMAQQNIDNMQLRAPIAGIVALAQNLDATGGMILAGMDIPEFREGDQTSPGRLIANVLDVDQMEIFSKVTETDRGSLDSGRIIEAKINALPLQKFPGRVKSLAGMAASSSIFTDISGIRTFDASFELNPNGAVLSPGCTAQVTIMGGTIKDALSLPRQALFQKEGKPTVYVKRADTWESHEIHVKFLTESRVVLDGLPEGTEVALVNPDLEKEKAEAKSGGFASILGGFLQ